METNNPVLRKKISVGIIQQPPVYLNTDASTDRAIDFISQLAASNVELIVFPETWLPGYPVWLDLAPKAGIWDYQPARDLYRILSEQALVIGDTNFERLTKAAKSNKSTVVMGAHERIDRTVYNSIFYFLGDGSFSVHRKLMPTYTERLIWGMGDGSTLPIVKLNDTTRIGGLICWEHWMPLARTAMQSQNEHIHIAQWPMVKELHQLASRNYAFEGQCYVIAAGATLTKKQMLDGFNSVTNSKTTESAFELLNSIEADEQDFLLGGGSAIIRPDSTYLVPPVPDKNELIVAELNLEILSEGNLFLDTNGHYSRPDVFHLQVNTNPKGGVTFEN